MGTGYTRNDTSNNIADGNIINAADLDGEFDAVESAFNSSTGHTHDGTAAEGGAITVVGPVQDLVVSATEVKPKTTNTLDLGTSGLLYKDAYLQGNMYFRDTALKIVSSADGQLDIDADVELELVAPTVDIDASTAVTIDTATLTITGSANIVGDLDVDNININGNTIISTDTNGNIALTPNGTGEVDISKVDIDSGAIDGVTLGTNSAVTEAQVDNININGNTIISTDTNGDINISPDGTGTVVIDTDLDVDNININGNTISSTDTNGNINLSPNGTGVVALSSTDLTFGDNDKAIFGDGSDLQLYHDGTNSFVLNTVGELVIRNLSDDKDIFLQTDDGSGSSVAYVQCDGSTGEVKLNHYGSTKLTTTATGVDVTGTVAADRLDIDYGVASSAAALIDHTDTANGNGVLITAGGSNSGKYVLHGRDGSGNSRFYVSSNGNVGIGEDAPSSLLHMTGASPQLRIEASSGNSQINFADTADSNIGILAYDHSVNAMWFRTNDSERMRIDSSGNVGIGNTNPTYKLSILENGNNFIQFLQTGDGVAGSLIGRSSSTNLRIQNSENAATEFWTNNTERMRIDSSGDLNILSGNSLRVGGTTDESATGVVNAGLVYFRNSNTPSGERFQLDCEGSATGQTLTAYYYNGTNYRNRMSIAGNDSGVTVFNESGQDIDFRIESSLQSNAFFVNGGTSNVGINRAPSYELDVGAGNNANSEIRILAGSDSGADAVLRLQCQATAGTRDSAIYFGDSSNTSIGRITYGHENNDFRIFTNGTECLRIDSSGNLLVSTTDSTPSTNNNASGIAIRNTGQLNASCGSEAPLDINRTSSEGTLVLFRTGGTLQGRMGVTNTYVYLGSDCGIQPRASDIVPTDSVGGLSDNNIDLGDPSARYDDIYATNGTINTSDANEKQQIAALTDAEVTAAKAISGLFKTFKWNSAVEAKGDAARTHAGVIAQDVQAAMTAAGLDAGDYAFFIASTWWETQTEVPAVEAVEAVEAVYEDVIIPAVEEELDEEGNVIVEAQPERTEQRLVSEAIEAVEAVDAYTRTDAYDTAEEAPEGAVERTRLGIRYPELLAFVGAATEQRLANIETRLTALEAN